MLVIVHHGDRQLCLQPALDLEAFGGFDILEVNSSEGRSNSLDSCDECLGIGSIYLDVEGIHS